MPEVPVHRPVVDVVGPRGDLAQLLSLELAVDDTKRRQILLSGLPRGKVRELETRVRVSVDSLSQTEHLAPQLRRSLLGFFGIARHHAKTAPSSAALVSVIPQRSLFPHQKRAATSVERYLYDEDGRAMLHLPTGVGKTRTAMSIVASHLRARAEGLVLWLAATQELLEQAAQEFESTWRTVGDRPVSCARFWTAHHPSIMEVADGIIVAGLSKLHSFGTLRERLWHLGDRTTMVVFDEAHQAVATTYQDLVDTIVTRNVKTPFLGLSATPGRTWADPRADATVADLFYGNKVTLDFDGENPIRHLMSEGYLATVEFSHLNVEPGIALTDDDRVELTRSLDIPDQIVKRLGQDDERNLRIVQRLLELVDRHPRVLVFAASVDNARLLTSIARGVGLKADVVTGDTEPSERRYIIGQFKRAGGASRVLVNYGVLTTGFDAPAASAALVARPTKSLVLYSQMVGRVMRGPRAGGTPRCEVVTVVDTTLPGFGDVAEAFLNWEDVWSTG